MITGKTIALTIWTFVDQVMSLLFNVLSSFVIAFLPRSECLLISWLQSLSAVILEPRKIKSGTCFHFFPFYLLLSDGTGWYDLSFFNFEFQANFFTLHFHPHQEKAMALHSSTLAWKIPWTEEPGRLQPMGSLESDTTERLHFHFSLSCTGGGNGNPLQCFCLENPRDGGAWWAAVYGVAQSRTRLK